MRYFDAFTGIGLSPIPTGIACIKPCYNSCMVNKYTYKPIDFAKAVALYESGLTQAEVAKQIGVSQKVIFTTFARHKYKSRRAIKRNQFGEFNSSWKGTEAQYQAFHRRVEAKRGKPRVCAACDTSDAQYYDWASLTKRYHLLNDYIRLCRKCHSQFDKRSAL